MATGGLPAVEGAAGAERGSGRRRGDTPGDSPDGEEGESRRTTPRTGEQGESPPHPPGRGGQYPPARPCGPGPAETPRAPPPRPGRSHALPPARPDRQTKREQSPAAKPVLQERAASWAQQQDRGHGPRSARNRHQHSHAAPANASPSLQMWAQEERSQGLQHSLAQLQEELGASRAREQRWLQQLSRVNKTIRALQ